MKEITWPIYAIAAVALVLTGAAVGWWIEGLRWEADVATIQQQHSSDLTLISNAAQLQTNMAIARQKQAEADAARIDNEHSEKLKNAQAENNSLRDAVIAGTRRVRIAEANLATSRLTAGGDPSTSGMGNGAQVELTATAGRTVYDIRAGIISDQAKLGYLQDYTRDVVKRCKIQ